MFRKRTAALFDTLGLRWRIVRRQLTVKPSGVLCQSEWTSAVYPLLGRSRGPVRGWKQCAHTLRQSVHSHAGHQRHRRRVHCLVPARGHDRHRGPRHRVRAAPASTRDEQCLAVTEDNGFAALADAGVPAQTVTAIEDAIAATASPPLLAGVDWVLGDLAQVNAAVDSCTDYGAESD
jgi:hypothetical protein